eukprot:gnl/TRDRNA2_/TRDRNA2_85560_c0_seq2.p1 gnl/TRDRNA2_/TRDRNA2_85560_c0~~gnl/TRDRNA2_/TRDRNA2_85560_c0_seq2.p1  ORF type:complete len:116 (+),score=20.83 gnl/TRDRNA2_/TRDRNA2_85560_c0_seq2:63-410(+)
MASMMFLGFISNQRVAYEDRVDHQGEGTNVRDLWDDMEEKCWHKYLDEINDDEKGVHVYQVLKHKVKECKVLMHHDNRREVLQQCHRSILSLATTCASSAPPAATSAGGAPRKVE